MPKRKTHEEFVKELEKVSPSISAVEKYQNSRTKIKVQCKICGYQWQTIPSDLLSGHGCPRCSGKERKTTARFCKEVAEANPKIIVIGEYINTSTKIMVRCKTCGYSWAANPSTLLKGNGCPSCGGTKKVSNNEFIKKLAVVNPDIEPLEEYKNNHTKIMVRCIKCGHKWSVTPHNLIDNRSRCPMCTHASTSFIEQFIVEWLSRVLGTDAVKHRDLTAIGSELDIYVPELNLAFEPGSWYWHKEKKENDSLKRIRCREKGIRLITIYDDVPKDELFVSTDVIMFPFDVRAQKKYHHLANLLISVIQEQGANVDNLLIDLEDVANIAYKNSVKTDTDEFAEKLKANGIDVKLLGIYKSSSSRIRVQCNICDHIWSPCADTLLSGHSSCKKCGAIKNGKAHLKSHDKYILEVKERNPTVEIVGQYTKAADKIHARCRICGFEWYPVANTLVKKNPTACPKCGKIKMIQTRMQNKHNRKQ
ncbi:MAG: hypothetical protein K6F23_13320 [Solobacterium sp.]|nr:hypothetical protein [Solobacterium sp.]